MSYISLGGGGSGGGSAYFVDPVANFATLPGGVPTGTIGLTLDSGIVYYYDGAAWEPVDTELASIAASDTNSIDLTVTGGVLTADLKLSATAAGAGFFKNTSTVDSGGLYVTTQEATGSQTGVLKSADWTTFNNKVNTSRAINTTAPITGGGDLSADRTIAMAVATGAVDGYLSAANFTTFNNKEPSVTAATTGDYYRGDKTFQPLNVTAIAAYTDGSSAGAGKINELLTATQATNTATGIGATTTWGSATSVSLTAGRWLIWGSAGLNENGATLTDSIAVGISSSAAGVGISEFDTSAQNALISSTADAILATPMKIVSISSTTSYHLNTKFNYTSGAPRHRGKISAVRIG